MKTWLSATKSVLSIAVDVYKHFDSVGKKRSGNLLHSGENFKEKFLSFCFSLIRKTLKSNLLRFYFRFFSKFINLMHRNDRFLLKFERKINKRRRERFPHRLVFHLNSSKQSTGRHKTKHRQPATTNRQAYINIYAARNLHVFAPRNVCCGISLSLA